MLSMVDVCDEFGLLWRLRVRGRIKVVRDIDEVSLVSIGQGAEAIDVPDGAQRGPVEGRVAAGLGDADVGGCAVPLHLESDVGAVSGGLRVEHSGEPLLRDLLRDLLTVVGESGSEAGVGDADAYGSGASLGAAHRNADAGR